MDDFYSNFVDFFAGLNGNRKLFDRTEKEKFLISFNKTLSFKQISTFQKAGIVVLGRGGVWI